MENNYQNNIVDLIQKALGKSYKTSIFAVLLIASGVLKIALAFLANEKVDYKEVAPEILGGIGLLFAKDHDATDGNR